MRLVPESRYYACSTCASKFLVVLPAIGDALQHLKPVKTFLIVSTLIVAGYGFFVFEKRVPGRQGAVEKVDAIEAPKNVTEKQPARHESNISQGDLEASFTWDKDPTVTAYHIYWLEKPGVTKTNGNKISNVASPHTVKGLKKGNTYYFVITAVDGQFESEESDEISLTAGE